ncbi:uncharacterized protein A1O9_11702 [Exophiala aquamarina CBS 119918]|uniref:Chitin synthase n=1 Tax=Exophiala aquamarina CBS 119918 TaxID=1182545 RepID=A0A072NWT4_9EURO|nr:uncharacterized protein A1O9_11702 [Exophiala aquamarina CBS 119918]KEF52076.1 hypothetical protein A1O9_11702 [Exophiala aquamarina CBS 119918]
MLDLNNDFLQLHNTSGASYLETVERPHLPVLEQGYQRWGDDDLGQTPRRQYVRYQRFRGMHHILDLPVAPKLYNSVNPVRSGLQQRYQKASRNEFSHVRYTPVTCDPSEFVHEGYTLQQQLFKKPRKTEICIAVTMYNEEEWLLGKTLEALHRNIKNLQGEERAAPWGPSSWQKVVVCIISDGRNKINRKTKALLAALGVYQDVGIMQSVDGRDVTMHLFEYTTHSVIRCDGMQVSLDLDSAGGVPCQTIFCLKEKNQKKINSHRWFVTAICEVLDPAICVFLDAGAIPRDEALYHLWKPLHENPTVAATTGFCTSYANSALAETINPIVAFQKFEYQLTNTLERPVEALFGRRFAINKGGFAAYRWTTASNPDGIFRSYFDAERAYNESPSRANLLLVEDRTISANLLHTNLDVWRTIPVDSATVDVDIPLSFEEFCLQRRRWLNGDFYATLHEVKSTPRYISFGTSTKLIRCLGLLVGAFYQILMTGLQYFAVGNLFIFFFVLTNSMYSNTFWGAGGHWVTLVLTYLYVLGFAVGVLLSIGNRPQSTKLYACLSFLWIMFGGYLFAVLVYFVVQASHEINRLSGFSNSSLLRGQLFLFLVWPLAGIITIWLIAPLTLGQKPHTLASSTWYPLWLVVHVNLVSAYAWCNVHDIIWGVKGNDRPEALPIVKVNNDVVIPDTDVYKEIDPQSGDLILHNFIDHVQILDGLLEANLDECQSRTLPETRTRDISTKQADSYRTFRTLTVFLWITLNSFLVMVVINIPKLSTFRPTASGGEGLLYIGIILWAYAGLTGFQYGCTILYAMRKSWRWVLTKLMTGRLGRMNQSQGEA